MKYPVRRLLAKVWFFFRKNGLNLVLALILILSVILVPLAASGVFFTGGRLYSGPRTADNQQRYDDNTVDGRLRNLRFWLAALKSHYSPPASVDEAPRWEYDLPEATGLSITDFSADGYLVDHEGNYAVFDTLTPEQSEALLRTVTRDWFRSQMRRIFATSSFGKAGRRRIIDVEAELEGTAPKFSLFPSEAGDSEVFEATSFGHLERLMRLMNTVGNDVLWSDPTVALIFNAGEGSTIERVNPITLFNALANNKADYFWTQKKAALDQIVDILPNEALDASGDTAENSNRLGELFAQVSIKIGSLLQLLDRAAETDGVNLGWYLSRLIPRAAFEAAADTTTSGLGKILDTIKYGTNEPFDLAAIESLFDTESGVTIDSDLGNRRNLYRFLENSSYRALNHFSERLVDADGTGTSTDRLIKVVAKELKTLFSALKEDNGLFKDANIKEIVKELLNADSTVFSAEQEAALTELFLPFAITDTDFTSSSGALKNDATGFELGTETAPTTYNAIFKSTSRDSSFFNFLRSGNTATAAQFGRIFQPDALLTEILLAADYYESAQERLDELAPFFAAMKASGDTFDEGSGGFLSSTGLTLDSFNAAGRIKDSSGADSTLLAEKKTSLTLAQSRKIANLTIPRRSDITFGTTGTSSRDSLVNIASDADEDDETAAFHESLKSLRAPNNSGMRNEMLVALRELAAAPELQKEVLFANADFSEIEARSVAFSDLVNAFIYYLESEVEVSSDGTSEDYFLESFLLRLNRWQLTKLKGTQELPGWALADREQNPFFAAAPAPELAATPEETTEGTSAEQSSAVQTSDGSTLDLDDFWREEFDPDIDPNIASAPGIPQFSARDSGGDNYIARIKAAYDRAREEYTAEAVQFVFWPGLIRLFKIYPHILQEENLDIETDYGIDLDWWQPAADESASASDVANWERYEFDAASFQTPNLAYGNENFSQFSNLRERGRSFISLSNGLEKKRAFLAADLEAALPQFSRLNQVTLGIFKHRKVKELFGLLRRFAVPGSDRNPVNRLVPVPSLSECNDEILRGAVPISWVDFDLSDWFTSAGLVRDERNGAMRPRPSMTIASDGFIGDFEAAYPAWYVTIPLKFLKKWTQESGTSLNTEMIQIARAMSGRFKLPFSNRVRNDYRAALENALELLPYLRAIASFNTSNPSNKIAAGEGSLAGVFEGLESSRLTEHDLENRLAAFASYDVYSSSSDSIWGSDGNGLDTPEEFAAFADLSALDLVEIMYENEVFRASASSLAAGLSRNIHKLRILRDNPWMFDQLSGSGSDIKTARDDWARNGFDAIAADPEALLGEGSVIPSLFVPTDLSETSPWFRLARFQFPADWEFPEEAIDFEAIVEGMLLGGAGLNGAAANILEADSTTNNKTIVQIAFSYAYSKLLVVERENLTIDRLIVSFESLFPEMRGLFKDAAEMGEDEDGIGIALEASNTATPASIVVRNTEGGTDTQPPQEDQKLDLDDTIVDEYSEGETEEEEETTPETEETPDQPQPEDEEEKLDLEDAEVEESPAISAEKTVLTFDFKSATENTDGNPWDWVKTSTISDVFKKGNKLSVAFARRFGVTIIEEDDGTLRIDASVNSLLNANLDLLRKLNNLSRVLPIDSQLDTVLRHASAETLMVEEYERLNPSSGGGGNDDDDDNEDESLATIWDDSSFTTALGQKKVAYEGGETREDSEETLRWGWSLRATNQESGSPTQLSATEIVRLIDYDRNKDYESTDNNRPSDTIGAYFAAIWKQIVPLRSLLGRDIDSSDGSITPFATGTTNTLAAPFADETLTSTEDSKKFVDKVSGESAVYNYSLATLARNLRFLLTDSALAAWALGTPFVSVTDFDLNDLFARVSKIDAADETSDPSYEIEFRENQDLFPEANEALLGKSTTADEAAVKKNQNFRDWELPSLSYATLIALKRALVRIGLEKTDAGTISSEDEIKTLQDLFTYWNKTAADFFKSDSGGIWTANKAANTNSSNPQTTAFRQTANVRTSNWSSDAVNLEMFVTKKVTTGDSASVVHPDYAVLDRASLALLEAFPSWTPEMVVELQNVGWTRETTPTRNDYPSEKMEEHLSYLRIRNFSRLKEIASPTGAATASNAVYNEAMGVASERMEDRIDSYLADSDVDSEMMEESGLNERLTEDYNLLGSDSIARNLYTPLADKKLDNMRTIIADLQRRGSYQDALNSEQMLAAMRSAGIDPDSEMTADQLEGVPLEIINSLQDSLLGFNTETSESRTRNGVIIGASVAGVLVFLIAALIVFYVQRKKNEEKKSRGGGIRQTR